MSVESTVVGAGGLSRNKLMMMRQMSETMAFETAQVLGHCNVSGLGVLKRYGKYKDFEVIENFTASNFIGVKLNICTSGSSGNLTATLMVTKNYIVNSRELAQSLRSRIQAMLENIN